MKLILAYIKSRLYIYGVVLLFFIIYLFSFLLFHLPIEAVVYPFLLCIFFGAAISLIDYKIINRRHRLLMRITSITDVMDGIQIENSSIIENDLKKVIKLISEEHKIFSEKTGQEYSNMVDYYTVWAHQIKTPIAAMRLTLQNEDSPTSRKLYGDLRRIEQYVEMVLTFLRLNSESSDYLIKEIDIDNIIKQSVKKFSYDFITRKLSLVYQPVNKTVITDEKWLSFVIEQILSNSLKYTKSGSITISVSEDDKLSIADTGIGIAPEDLPRIFENGYTGFNGRTDKKASGIGLYLCKRICTNLGHSISAKSNIDEGTVITIDLSQRKLDVE